MLRNLDGKNEKAVDLIQHVIGELRSRQKRLLNVSHQTPTSIWKLGGYRECDSKRIGLPLVLLMSFIDWFKMFIFSDSNNARSVNLDITTPAA